jgi:hypothetical protein
MKSSTFIALLLTSGIAPGAQSPSEAAVMWLREVAAGKAEEKPGEHTALSPETSEEDVRTIQSQLGQLRKNLRPDDLKVVADMQDGELAAVLVSQITDFDANTVQIHAVGLVKSADQWLPAPLPSSFDSTGLSFRPGFLQRVKALEKWMLLARTEQLVRLKNDAFALLNEEMRKFKTPDQLQEATPEKLAGDFLTAVQARDLPAVLALLGGLENPRPADWDDIYKVTSRILRKKEFTHPLWRLIGAPEAARAIVAAETGIDDPLVTIVALDPAANFRVTPLPRAIDLPFVRSKAGTWRIRLTHAMMAPETLKAPTGLTEQEAQAAERKRREQEEDDARIAAPFLEKFPEKLAGSLGTAHEKTAPEAAEKLLAALRAPSLAPVCVRMDLTTTPATALNALGRVAYLWQRIHLPFAECSPVLLEIHEAGDDAWALVQMFSGREPASPSIETLFFKRSPEGWTANPGFAGESALPYLADEAAVSAQLEPALAARDAEWWNGLLNRVGGIAADSAPSEADTRRVVEESRKAVAEGDVLRFFSLAACLDDERGPQDMLKACSNDFTGREGGEILAIHRLGRWAAASLRIPSREGDDSVDTYPLVIVVGTQNGARVLPEINLFDPPAPREGRSRRELLNRSVMDRVATRLPEAARGEIEAIYEKHRTISAAARGRNKPTE